MKRIIISVIIIAAIIAAGCFAIVGIEAENAKIYGAIEEVLNSDSQEEAEMAVGGARRGFPEVLEKALLHCG